MINSFVVPSFADERSGLESPLVETPVIGDSNSRRPTAIKHEDVPEAYVAQPIARASIASKPPVDGLDAGLKQRYEDFLAANDIEVAGIEFVADADGTIYSYDVNTTTNYDVDAERRADRPAMTTPSAFSAPSWPACGRRGDGSSCLPPSKRSDGRWMPARGLMWYAVSHLLQQYIRAPQPLITRAEFNRSR